MSNACPRCGNPADALVPIEAGMRLALQAQADGLPSEVCASCHQYLAGQVSQGYKLRIEHEQRNKNKVIMWKSRVQLIKQARTFMSAKAYSEAAVSYEKYIRLLEVVYNLDRGQLSPKVFNNSARSKELTVIASVYWDLVRIYDTNPGYGDRMRGAAEKLAQFLPFSPIYPDVIKRAESFSRTARNPQIVKSFLRASRTGRAPCFIATAVYADDPFAWELSALRQFRDQRLRTTPAGRRLIWIYYRWSPPVAQRLKKYPVARAILKPMLSRLARLLDR